MAALTTFLAGFAMIGVQVESFLKLAIFLMLVMAMSWLYAIFFFLPLLASIDRGTRMFWTWYHSSSYSSGDKDSSHVTMSGRGKVSPNGGLRYVTGTDEGPRYITGTEASIAEFKPELSAL